MMFSVGNGSDRMFGQASMAARRLYVVKRSRLSFREMTCHMRHVFTAIDGGATNATKDHVAHKAPNRVSL